MHHARAVTARERMMWTAHYFLLRGSAKFAPNAISFV